MQAVWIWSLGREDPLEKEMATNSSILAWDIPWTEDPSGLQSRGHKSIEQNLVTKQPWTEPGTKDTEKKKKAAIHDLRDVFSERHVRQRNNY